MTVARRYFRERPELTSQRRELLVRSRFCRLDQEPELLHQGVDVERMQAYEMQVERLDARLFLVAQNPTHGDRWPVLLRVGMKTSLENPHGNGPTAIPVPGEPRAWRVLELAERQECGRSTSRSSLLLSRCFLEAPGSTDGPVSRRAIAADRARPTEARTRRPDPVLKNLGAEAVTDTRPRRMFVRCIGS